MITNLTFDNPADYDFDSNFIEIISGQAALKLFDAPGVIGGDDFSSSTGFTFDSEKIIHDNNSFKQKSQAPANATCHCTFDNLDLNWGDGTLTATATGGAAVSSGKLDLAHNDVRYVDYPAVGNADSVQVGAIRFKVTPSYSGTPAANMIIALISKSTNDNNRIEIRQRTSDGGIVIVIFDSTGTSIMANSLGVWNPTALTEYEFELNWDITLGSTRLFIDGTQHGSTLTQTGTRSSDVDIIRIGSSRLASESSNFQLDDLMIFDTVQHTTDYTPAAYAVPFEFVEASLELPILSSTYPGPGDVQSFDSWVPRGEVGNIRYIGNDLYWTGAVWVASDGSYAQSTSSADINTNLATFPVANTMPIKVIFPDSNTQGILDELYWELTGQMYSTVKTPITPVNGILAEGLDNIEITSSGSDLSLAYTILVNDVEKYHNGSNWVDSSGSAQANTDTEITANIGSIDIAEGKTIKIRTYLASQDGIVPGYSTPSVDNIRIQFDFHGVFPGDPAECIVFGYVYDNDGDPIENVVVKATLSASYEYNSEILIVPKTITVITDSFGYWDISLIENDNMPAGSDYTFTFTINGSDVVERRIVPNEVSKNYATLTKV